MASSPMLVNILFMLVKFESYHLVDRALQNSVAIGDIVAVEQRSGKFIISKKLKSSKMYHHKETKICFTF